MKSLTRRYLAWGLVGLATVTICFALVWGVVTRQMELVTPCLALLSGMISAIITYYYTRGKGRNNEA